MARVSRARVVLRPKGSSPDQIGAFMLLVRPVLAAVGIVIIVFGVYEVVERLWLGHVDPHTLHGFHRTRGILSALLAATLAGWLILRRFQPLLASALSTDEPVDGARRSDQERTAVYARWFILMRWVAVLVALVLVYITVEVADLLPAELRLPLFATIGGLALLNGIYAVTLRRGVIGRRLLAAQAYADLVILTMLLHLSGGLENPLAPLMLFHVIIAGIILSRRHCYTVAAAASILFAALAWAEVTHVLPHYTLEIFPHFEHEGHVTHASHQPLYAASRVVLQTAILFLSAFFVTSLTDRLRRDEEQLKRFADRVLTERQLLERALETTGTGLCVCDGDLRPLWHNRQWDAWFGEPLRPEVSRQLHGAESPAMATARDGAVRVAEITVSTDDARLPGESVAPTYQTTAAPLLDHDGRISHVVQLIQDVTAQKHAQAQMMRAGRLAAVGELAGQVAHEVNNPIAIISAKARLLLDRHGDELSERTIRELRKITELSDRVARIAQGLLSYCRPAAGARAPMDIRTPLRKSLSLVDQHARMAEVHVMDRLPDEPLTVHANAGEMEQVFLNLLLNSLDAMPHGGALTIRADRVGDAGVQIVLEDTGIGIDPELQPRVFEPFFTTKPEGEGTGLGLSICLGLVRSHGGTLDLTSEPGNGTRITIRLPADVRNSAVEDSPGVPEAHA